MLWNLRLFFRSESEFKAEQSNLLKIISLLEEACKYHIWIRMNIESFLLNQIPSHFPVIRIQDRQRRINFLRWTNSIRKVFNTQIRSSYGYRGRHRHVCVRVWVLLCEFHHRLLIVLDWMTSDCQTNAKYYNCQIFHTTTSNTHRAYVWIVE